MKGLLEQMRYVRMLNMVQKNVVCQNVKYGAEECSMSEC